MKRTLLARISTGAALVLLCGSSALADDFRRGDANADGAIGLSDATHMLRYLFLPGEAPSCADAADVDDDGVLRITDPIVLLRHVFLGGPAPVAPFAACGPDPTPDRLDCASFPPCRALGMVTEAWVVRYDRAQGRDRAEDVVVDGAGNVYIAGMSQSDGASIDNHSDDFLTMKLDGNGEIVWVAWYAGSVLEDYGNGLALDGVGNVYVSGASASSDDLLTYSLNLALVKYDPDGEELWVERVPYPFSYGIGRPMIDRQGNVHIAGWACPFDPQGHGCEENWSWTALEHSPAGEVLEDVLLESPSDVMSGFLRWTMDDAGNFYAAGSFDGDVPFRFLTAKYAADRNRLWLAASDGGDALGGGPAAIAVDREGNVIVSGFIGNFDGTDFGTIKYDAEGNELWVARYNGPGDQLDRVWCLAVDDAGSIFVSGLSWGGEATGFDYATVKYDAEGNELWVARYSGLGKSFDEPAAMALDAAGNVYVTGATNEGIATVKYDVEGREVWVIRYRDPASAVNFPRAIALDRDANVYVAGGSGILPDEDCVVIKYVQSR